MAVAVGTFTLSLPGVHSLKEKRSVLKGLRERIRQGFNVSIAEMELQDVWQSARIGICAISQEGAYVEGVMSKIRDFITNDRRVILVHYEVEVF